MERKMQVKIVPDPDSERVKAAKRTKAGQDKKKLYLETKRRLLEYEAENYTQIVVMKTQDDKWWKMFGHSAVFYKYLVAKRMKFRVKLLPDTDYDVVSEQGVVAIDSIEALQDKMKRAKIYPVKTTKAVVIFDLGERVTEQDYVLMLKEDEMRLAMTNKLILPEERVTELNVKVRDLHKLVHESVRKMDGVSREVFANEMEQKMVKLQLLVTRAARGTAEMDYCLNKAYDVTEDLYGYTLIIMNLRLLEPKKIYDIAEAVVALERQIKKEIKKLAMEKTEKETKKKVQKIKKNEDEKEE